MLFARFSISLKLLLLSALPLLLLVAFLSNEGKKLYETQKNSSQTEVIIKLALTLDNIAHQHAVERGLTAGFLGSNGAKGQDKMLEQRKRSDQSVDELKEFISAHQSNLKNINTNTDKLIDLLKQKNV